MRILLALFVLTIAPLATVLASSRFEEGAARVLREFCGRPRVTGIPVVLCYFRDVLDDHTERITTLESNAGVPLGTLAPPAFDSGWIRFAGQPSVIDVPHNVGGDINDYFVYVTYRRPEGNGTFMSHQTAADKVWWEDVEPNNIQIVRNGDVSNLFDAARVRIWRIPQSPSPLPSPTPPSNCAAAVSAEPIVVDDFNSYTDGSIVGQGGWENYVNADNFIVQGAVTDDGEKALHIGNAAVDNVVTKNGTPRADGKQAVCVRTENRSNWDFYPDGNAQFRVTKNSWAGGTDIFAAVAFKPDGHVAYFDVGTGQYQNFATYNDNEWTLLEIEWRSSDRTARYRVNSSVWTDWKTFKGAGSFANFDYVGFDFTRGGSGGVYFDTLR